MSAVEQLYGSPTALTSQDLVHDRYCTVYICCSNSANGETNDISGTNKNHMM